MSQILLPTATPLHSDTPRLACVHVPALPLQLVLRKHPDWRKDPTVVVEDDRAQAPILWVNGAARTANIQRGQPFDQAKALSAKLRAAVVPVSEVSLAVDHLFDQLLDFSPYVEPVLEMPGIFWLDPSGLAGLFGDVATWAQQLKERFNSHQYTVTITVGFVRPHLFALSRKAHAVHVHIFRCRTEERTKAHAVALRRLGVAAKLVDQMALLGIHRVEQFLQLPAPSIRLRYGPEAAELHAFLSGQTWTPLQPKEKPRPAVIEQALEPPDSNHTRLLFGLKNMLQKAINQLIQPCHAVTALELCFQLEQAPSHHERLETAAPTLDLMQWVDLVRLRLDTLQLAAPVEHISITLEQRRVHPKQLAMEQKNATRDLDAANRALSRLKAMFGKESITLAKLHNAHLPEGCFKYVATDKTQFPSPSLPNSHSPHAFPLVRRLVHPIPLPAIYETKCHGQNHKAQSHTGHLGPYGGISRIYPPHRISGGWWIKPRERDYHFIETDKGALVWAFHDRITDRWFLHGIVS